MTEHYLKFYKLVFKQAGKKKNPERNLYIFAKYDTENNINSK